MHHAHGWLLYQPVACGEYLLENIRTFTDRKLCVMERMVPFSLAQLKGQQTGNEAAVHRRTLCTGMQQLVSEHCLHWYPYAW